MRIPQDITKRTDKMPRKNLCTKEQIEFIKKNVKGLFNEELTKLVNDTFGTNFTTKQIRGLKHTLKIDSGIRGGRKKKPIEEMYNKEHVAFIKKHAKGIITHKLTDLLNNTFKTNYTVRQIQKIMKRHGIKNGVDCRYKKGHIPFNKGTRGLTKANSGSFKIGHRPKNYRPVGSERVSIYGYVEIKVADPDVWRLKHVVEWEKVNGPIPQGMKLLFLDQNPLNISVDNLALISRAEGALLNKDRLLTKDAEINKSALTLTRLILKRNQILRKRGDEKHAEK